VTASAPQSGNIRYIVVRQAFKWQQIGNSAATDWQHMVLFSKMRLDNAAAVKNGYRLDDYRKATANYALLRAGTWMAFFECNAPTPDKNFCVWIDDRTGDVRVEPWEKRQ
jgi:hypothetical protein